MKFHLITLFEDACDAYLSASIIGRARKEKKIIVKYQNPRDFAEVPRGAGKFAYRKVDDRPYGGGPGMVMMAISIVKAVQKALGRKDFVSPSDRRKYGFTKPVIIWFSPSAKQFTNKDADGLMKYSDVVLICGRYEGIDERAKKMLETIATVKEFAVGEATLTGGEVPALAVVDSITRRIPGVLGKDESVEERRIAAHQVYTRPETILYKKKKYNVPKVLLTGHQAKIDAWRERR